MLNIKKEPKEKINMLVSFTIICFYSREGPTMRTNMVIVTTMLKRLCLDLKSLKINI